MRTEEKEKKETERLYGNLITEFINAKDVKEALFKARENIGPALGFSSNFAERARKKINNGCQLHIDPGAGLEISVGRYWGSPSADLVPDFDLQIAFLEAIRNEESKQLKKAIEELPNKLKSENLSKQRIERVQEDYRQLHGTSALGLLVQFYNNWCRPHCWSTPEGFIIEGPPVSEDYFLKEREEVLPFDCHIVVSLIYCLIEFLRNPKNREYIRQCDKCDKYFVASKNDKRFIKCHVCSPKSNLSKERKREVMRKWRQKKKEEKKAQEREERIKNYMSNLDLTREEAEEIIEADLKL